MQAMNAIFLVVDAVVVDAAADVRFERQVKIGMRR